MTEFKCLNFQDYACRKRNRISFDSGYFGHYQKNFEDFPWSSEEFNEVRRIFLKFRELPWRSTEKFAEDFRRTSLKMIGELPRRSLENSPDEVRRASLKKFREVSWRSSENFPEEVWEVPRRSSEKKLGEFHWMFSENFPEDVSRISLRQFGEFTWRNSDNCEFPWRSLENFL